MKKMRFFEDAKLDPGRYYRNPIDVLRDRRLNQEERLLIVTAWEHGMQQRLASAAVREEGAAEKLIELQKLRATLRQELESVGATTKPQ